MQLIVQHKINFEKNKEYQNIQASKFTLLFRNQL